MQQRASAVAAVLAAALLAACAGEPRADPCASSSSPLCGQDHPIPDRPGHGGGGMSGGM